uniref:Uncharacterized protein n=1 Tax=Acrobeloides nanus TaxID=290746 RepID=A0A914D3P5_9BILA
NRNPRKVVPEDGYSPSGATVPPEELSLVGSIRENTVI